VSVTQKQSQISTAGIVSISIAGYSELSLCRYDKDFDVQRGDFQNFCNKCSR
jgi:hypothetical protein